MLGECGVLCVGSVVCCVRAAVYCFAPYMCVYVSVWSWVCLCVGVVMGVYMCLHIHCTHPGTDSKVCCGQLFQLSVDV